MQLSRLGSGLEAFSHNPSGGSITALSDRTTVDTRDPTWEFLSYYPILAGGVEESGGRAVVEEKRVEGSLADTTSSARCSIAVSQVLPAWNPC